MGPGYSLSLIIHVFILVVCEFLLYFPVPCVIISSFLLLVLFCTPSLLLFVLLYSSVLALVIPPLL